MLLLDRLRRRAVATADDAAAGRLNPDETRSAEEGLRRLLRTYGTDEGLFLSWCAVRASMDQPDAQADSRERVLAAGEKKTNS